MTQREDLAAIGRDLARGREDLRLGRWSDLLSLFTVTTIRFKGRERRLTRMRDFAARKTRSLADLELLVDDVLDARADARLAHCSVRIALVGRRGATLDGIIVDADLRLERRVDHWYIGAAEVRCPPSWATWHARPNDLAPVFYGSVAG